MEHTTHRGMVGTTIGKDKESFSDLDFVNDVALLALTLSVPVLALEVMDTEAQPLGMSYTAIQLGCICMKIYMKPTAWCYHSVI